MFCNVQSDSLTCRDDGHQGKSPYSVTSLLTEANAKHAGEIHPGLELQPQVSVERGWVLIHGEETMDWHRLPLADLWPSK